MSKTTEKQTIREALAKRLFKLQAESAAVQTVIAKTNQLEYENLAAIYLWWRAAVTVPEYLEEAYKPTMVRRVFGENTGELSFRRLLYLMYGIYGLDKDSLDRKNRGLLSLHQEYEKNHALYAKDGVNKLAGFIKSRGGISSLIGSAGATNVPGSASGLISKTSSVNSDSEAVTSDAEPSVSSSFSPAVTGYSTHRPQAQPRITDAQRTAALSDEAQAFFASQSAAQPLSIHPPIATDKQGYAVAVVKRTAQGYEVVASTDSGLDLKDIMVSAYSKRLDAVPYSMRCILELLKTQTLPAPLLKLYDKLLETSAEKREDNSKRKITRQVAYMAQENMLLLSPTFASSGVVTMAKLHKAPFAGAAVDCFMPTRCRKVLEQRLLASNDFNLFKPQDDIQIPTFAKPDLCSHLLRLENKANAADFMFVEFWAYEEAITDANRQLVFVPSLGSSQRAINLDVDQADFRRLVYDHIRPWLLSYGEHLTRPANKVLQFGIAQTGFVLAFDWVNGAFRNQARSDFAQQAAGLSPVAATFLAKDLCLALNGIADLPLCSAVQMSWSEDVLVLRYSTDIADYSVAIPVTVGSRRKESAFAQYAPAISASAREAITDASEADDELMFEAAQAMAARPLTDAEIERLLGLQHDDYDDIVEGLFNDYDFADQDGATE